MTPSNSNPRAQKTLLVFVVLAIVSMGLSVSSTHIFIALSFLAFLYTYFFFPKTFFKQKKHPWLLYIGFAYYLWLIVTMIIRSLHEESFYDYFMKASKSELSDFALFLFACLIYKLHSTRKYKKAIEYAFYTLATVVIITGFLSLFSEFRLARLVRGFGQIASATNRPQHTALTLPSLTLYRPIGFMNTHLTYAGILSLSIFILIYPLTQNLKLYLKNRNLTKPLVYWCLLFLMAILLLFFNKARSILVGLFFLSSFVLLYLAKEFQLQFFAQKVWKHTFVKIILLCSALIVVVLVTNYSNEVREKVSSSLRHTDYSRPVIWTSSFDLINKSPFFGNGPGNFKKATWQWRHDYLKKNPDLMFYFYNSPDGHAHNDLLHTGVVSGYPSMLLYLILIYLIGHHSTMFLSKDSKHQPHTSRVSLLCMGLLVITIAGVFQCFFQDDEVVVFFWCIVGWVSSLENENPDT